MRTQFDIERDMADLNSRYKLLDEELENLKSPPTFVEAWTCQLNSDWEEATKTKFVVTKHSLKLHSKDIVADARGYFRSLDHVLAKDPSSQSYFSSEKLAMQAALAVNRRLIAQCKATLAACEVLRADIASLGG